MNRGFRAISARAFCLLAVSGFVAAAAPGCSDAPEQEEGEVALPESVQDSNQQMEDFMKSKQATPK